MTRHRRIALVLTALAGLGLSGCAADQKWQSSRIHVSEDLFSPDFLMASLANYQADLASADDNAVPPQDFRPIRIAASDSLGRSMYAQQMFYGYAYAGTIPMPADDDEAITLAK